MNTLEAFNYLANGDNRRVIQIKDFCGCDVAIEYDYNSFIEM